MMTATQTMPKVAEYRDVERNKWPLSRQTTLATATRKPDVDNPYSHKRPREYTLVHAAAGYESAGSMARWTDEHWAVYFYSDGARHGRRVRTESEAREVFEQWTS